jgi:hypothetical protein
MQKLLIPCICRVRLERVTTNGSEGYLVFVRYETRSKWMHGTASGLVVHISGDTLYSLCMLLQGKQPVRPMPLDLLSGMLNHIHDTSSNTDFGLIKVAITSLRGDTYFSRAFFGALPPIPCPVVATCDCFWHLLSECQCFT